MAFAANVNAGAMEADNVLLTSSVRLCRMMMPERAGVAKVKKGGSATSPRGGIAGRRCQWQIKAARNFRSRTDSGSSLHGDPLSVFAARRGRYADYIDVPRSFLDDNDPCEKQKPPLGQVTVS